MSSSSNTTNTPTNPPRRQTKRPNNGYQMDSTFLISDEEEELPSVESRGQRRGQQDLDESWTQATGRNKKKPKTSKKLKLDRNATATATASTSTAATSTSTSSTKPAKPKVGPKPKAKGKAAPSSTATKEVKVNGPAAGEKKVVKRKSKSKPSGSDQLVSDALECIICLDFAISPIHNCANGHITCGICTKKLDEKKCAMCKAKLTVSIFGERLAKQLERKLNCEYAENGCKELVKSTDMKKHIGSCYYRPIKCNEDTTTRKLGNSSHSNIDGDCSCDDATFPFNTYLSHLENQHRVKTVMCEPGNAATKMKFRLAKDGIGPLPISLFLYKNKAFLRMGHKTRETVFIWFTILGNKVEADKYRYELKALCENLQTKNVSMSWKMPVLPFHSEFGYKKKSCYLAAMPMTTLMGFGLQVPDKVPTYYDCRFELKIMNA